MGNNPSKPASGSAGGADGDSNLPHISGNNRDFHQSPSQHHSSRREPRRRDSIQALSSGKATAAPPSESHASATAHHNHSHRAQPGHTRQRSKTIDGQQRTAGNSDKMGAEQSKAQEERLAKEKPYNYNRPLPFAISGHPNDASNEDSHQSSGIPVESYYSAQSQTQRPPRLPLPIEEELHTPGSPIISPSDVSSALDHDTVEGALPRKSSLLSSTTIGDDEDEDVDAFQHPSDPEPPVTKTIPTYISWKKGGNKVYVTGTFARWDRKFRLHKTTDPNVLATTVNLSPGTHHIKFIVDGEMKLADDLPTAVDYTNILVNYIEISADDIPQDEHSKPVDILQPAHPPPGVFPPQVLPPTPEVPVRAPQAAGSQKPKQPTGELIPPKEYTSVIPQYLQELDQPEVTQQYQRASQEVMNTPSPPTLPLFLGKSILNATSSMKDDASVLKLPNHTVLNHLATSSIRQNILATSATTRYKRKYVSTILYKPSKDEGKPPT